MACGSQLHNGVFSSYSNDRLAIWFVRFVKIDSVSEAASIFFLPVQILFVPGSILTDFDNLGFIVNVLNVGINCSIT